MFIFAVLVLHDLISHDTIVICVCGSDECELMVDVRIVAVLGMVVTYNLFEVQTGTILMVHHSIITEWLMHNPSLF